MFPNEAAPSAHVVVTDGLVLRSGFVAPAVDIARLADGSGVSTLRLPDHVVIGERTDRYEWGPFPYPPDAPWLDPLTTIAAMAGR